MAQIEGEITINRPIERVFDFVANECNEPLYNEEMTSVKRVDDGPLGSGSRFEAVMSQRGREFPMTIEFTSFERLHRLGSHAEMEGMSTDGELTFEASGAATVMRWAWDVHPNGVLAWLTPLVTWMGRRQEQRIWASLKQYLEAETSQRPPCDDARGTEN